MANKKFRAATNPTISVKWSGPLNSGPAAFAPSIASDNDSIILITADDSRHLSPFRSSIDGTGALQFINEVFYFNDETILPPQSIGGGSVIFDPSVNLYRIAWTDPLSHHIMLMTRTLEGFPAGVIWTAPIDTGFVSSSVPAFVCADVLVPPGGTRVWKLHLAWLGNDGMLYSANSSDSGATWQSGTVGQGASSAPSMCFYSERLWLLWADSSPTAGLHLAASPDAVNWAKMYDIPHGTYLQPAICDSEFGLCALWTDSGNTPYIDRLFQQDGWDAPVTTYSTQSIDFQQSPAGVTAFRFTGSISDYSIQPGALWAGWLDEDSQGFNHTAWVTVGEILPY